MTTLYEFWLTWPIEVEIQCRIFHWQTTWNFFNVLITYSSFCKYLNCKFWNHNALSTKGFLCISTIWLTPYPYCADIFKRENYWNFFCIILFSILSQKRRFGYLMFINTIHIIKMTYLIIYVELFTGIYTRFNWIICWQ